MAVQKGRVSRSRRDKRRTHDNLTAATLSQDPETGEIHRRHQITPNGFYRGRKIILTKADKAAKKAAADSVESAEE
ncbi:MAG: 50S ribosomal protein L32 [Gammaproteobacteria bacterium]